MTRKLPVVLDCDPGLDDAIAILLALASPDELDVLGITTVAGNAPVAVTQRNARLVCDLAGRTDVAVFAGCDRPFVRRLVTSEVVHGATGLGSHEIVAPATPLRSTHAVAFLIEALLGAADESVTLVAMAPLTNLARAMLDEPRVLSKIARIVLMGGARREGGNHSPSAEYNVIVDPQAADVVFRCGRPIVVLGLDVTHRVPATVERIARVRALGTRVGLGAAGMLEFLNRNPAYHLGAPGPPLHDPCTVAYLLRPEIFVGRRCHLAVETSSELTIGHTSVDFWHVRGEPPNVEWIHDVDADAYYDLLVERLGRHLDR